MLAVINFAEIKNLSLNNAVVRRALVLNNAPVAVFFAVLKSPLRPEKHGTIVCWTPGENQGGRSALQAIFAIRHHDFKPLQPDPWQN